MRVLKLEYTAVLLIDRLISRYFVIFFLQGEDIREQSGNKANKTTKNNVKIL